MRLPTQLLRRKSNAHKGDFGHIFILAGSARFSGAALLSAEAALRSGAGLVTLGIPKGLNCAIIKAKAKEIMTLPLPQTKEMSLSIAGFHKIMNFIKTSDICLLGPGLGQDNSTKKLILKLIEKIAKPIIIDADALNALAGHLGLLKNRQGRTKILTPHPGEMSRLLKVKIKEIQEKRKKVAKNFAKLYNIILVLKGEKSVVTDGYKTYINQTGNPGMSTAGSGDVLSGIIAAFLGQGLTAFNAAKYATYLHGLAGDLAAKEKTELGLIASDIINKIPEAITKSS
jgi:NAD(P)H-hydrate epimerase